MQKVFVFGTLKKGFPLHERGLAGAAFLGFHRTVDAYPLVVAGPWFTPMMLDQPGEGFPVRGELYSVDGGRLQMLDRIESIGRPGNFRKLVPVRPIAGGAEVAAFVFMKSPELAFPVHSEPLQEYQDHRFIPPERRGPLPGKA